MLTHDRRYKKFVILPAGNSLTNNNAGDNSTKRSDNSDVGYDWFKTC